VRTPRLVRGIEFEARQKRDGELNRIHQQDFARSARENAGQENRHSIKPSACRVATDREVRFRLCTRKRPQKVTWSTRQHHEAHRRPVVDVARTVARIHRHRFEDRMSTTCACSWCKARVVRRARAVNLYGDILSDVAAGLVGALESRRAPISGRGASSKPRTAVPEYKG